MENASKALLIAGGLLIAMLVASLLVYLSNNVKTLRNAENEKKEQEQLIAFNRQYEAYNKPLLYGAEVVTVYNKANENNLNYQVTSNTQNYFIEVIILDITGTPLTYTSTISLTIYPIADIIESITNETTGTPDEESIKKEFKKDVFRCIGVEYSNITGRIKKLTFQKQDVP